VLRRRTLQQAVGMAGSGGEYDAAEKLAVQLHREGLAHHARHAVQVVSLLHERSHDGGRAWIHAQGFGDGARGSTLHRRLPDSLGVS